MSKQSRNEIRKQLIYDKTKLPVENIQQFYDAIKIMRYEFVEEKFNGESMFLLYSAWGNEVGLKKIINKFQESFIEHLVETSTALDDATYWGMLRECKRNLKIMNLSLRTSFTNILIINKGEEPGEHGGTIEYDDLEDDHKNNIYHCYELLGLFFSDLEDLVIEEMRDVIDNDYVRKNSKYEWYKKTANKEFVVLAAALFASGAVKIRGHKKFMENTFARDLAAFFGITNIYYDQYIHALHGEQKQPDYFLISMQVNFNKHLNEKLFPKKKKKS